eukprot:4321486-Pleurochrysis_carterae.AAC.1
MMNAEALCNIINCTCDLLYLLDPDSCEDGVYHYAESREGWPTPPDRVSYGPPPRAGLLP